MESNETTDLAKQEANEIQVAPANPLMAIIQAASTNGEVDADKMFKLIEAAERIDTLTAKKAYVVAMAAFKADPPAITKDMTVSYPTKGGGTTTFNHASLANVTDAIGKALSENGLTASWVTGQTEKGAVEVMCKITHILGHSESCKLQSAPDSSGGKNAIQAVGSAVTYLQRYTLLALTGLATYENENDGNPPAAKGPPKPDKNQEACLKAICDAMIDSVPDGLVLVDSRMDEVIYAQFTKYPDDPKKTGTQAAWLVNALNEGNSWETVCKKA